MRSTWPAPAPTAKITALKPPAPPSQRSPAQRSPSQPPSSQPSRLRDLKTGEVLNLTDKAHEKTGISKVPPELAPTNEVPAVKATRPLTMLDAKELPMAPVRNEHYRALRALADELDAYLTEVERDKAWWREPRFVIVSEGEAVGVILQPRPKKKRR